MIVLLMNRSSGKHLIQTAWSNSYVAIKVSSKFPMSQSVLSTWCGAGADEHSEDRVRAGAAKLSKMLAAKQQGRLDGFFSVKPKEEGGKPKGKGDDKKRKGDEKGGAKKKGKK
jgi:hypothetical protein